MLALVMAAGGAVCTRERILAEVWGRTWSGANRTLDVHVATLRTKLGAPAAAGDRARRRLPARAGAKCGRGCSASCWHWSCWCWSAWACRSGSGVAAAEQQEMFLDRLTDTSRFASLAAAAADRRQAAAACAPSWSGTTSCTASAWRCWAGTAERLRSRPGRACRPRRPRWPNWCSGALVGRLPAAPELFMPWSDAQLVLAEPVLVDGEVRGAVVTFSPTGKTRRRGAGVVGVAARGQPADARARCAAGVADRAVDAASGPRARRRDRRAARRRCVGTAGAAGRRGERTAGAAPAQPLVRPDGRERRRRARRAARVRRRRVAPAAQPVDRAEAATVQPGGARRRARPRCTRSRHCPKQTVSTGSWTSCWPWRARSPAPSTRCRSTSTGRSRSGCPRGSPPPRRKTCTSCWTGSAAAWRWRPLAGLRRCSTRCSTTR